MSTEREDSLESQNGSMIPASNFKRILAFGMDFVLLSFASTLLFFYIPKLHGQVTEQEFERLTERLSHALSSPDKDQTAVENLMIEFSEFTGNMNYELIMSLFFVLYFLIGEVFFGGRSVGKATFCLQTSSADKDLSLHPRQLVMRSFIKGISCSFMFLGLANLLFFIFNRNHRCLHDLASKTSTTQSR